MVLRFVLSMWSRLWFRLIQTHCVHGFYIMDIPYLGRYIFDEKIQLNATFLASNIAWRIKPTVLFRKSAPAMHAYRFRRTKPVLQNEIASVLTIDYGVQSMTDQFIKSDLALQCNCNTKPYLSIRFPALDFCPWLSF